MHAPKSQEQAWMEASTRLAVEAHKLLLQAKATMRAHDNMHAAASKCLESRFAAKHADNPLAPLMKAMGIGMELEGRLAEAAYRDGVAHLRISQVVDLLTDLRCLQEPAGLEENLAAMKAALLEDENIDVNERLNDDMTMLAGQDKEDRNAGEPGSD